MFKRKKLLIYAAATMAVLAGVGSFLLFRSGGEELAEVPTEEVAQKENEVPEQGFTRPFEEPDEPIPSFANSTESQREGDRALLGGAASRAYRIYFNAAEDRVEMADGAWLLRLAISSELAGALGQSLEHYRTIIQSDQMTETQKAWSLLGTARIWNKQGRLDDAIGLFSELLLNVAMGPANDDLKIAIQQHLTDTLLQQIVRNPPEDKLQLQGLLQYHRQAIYIEPVLASSDDIVPTEEVPQGVTLVQRPDTDATHIVIDAKVQVLPLDQLLADIGRRTGIDYRVTNKARRVLSGRTTKINARGISLALLQDQLLAEHDLHWDQEEDVVHVMHRTEASDTNNDRFLIMRTLRLLQQLELNANKQNKQTAAAIHDGNLNILLGNLEQAEIRYKAARELLPQAELSAKLYFNTAILQLLEKNDEAALQNLYFALDQTTDLSMQSVAYTQIAEIELQRGRPDKAITSASRAMRLAGDEIESVRSVMALAKSYLLTDDFYSANRVLFDNEDSLPSGAIKRLGSVIAGFSRLSAIGVVKGLQNESERLVIALAALREGDARSFIDHVLVARAFLAVGFRSKAMEHLKIASEGNLTDAWRAKIHYELSAFHFQAGELEEAQKWIAAASVQNDVQQQVQVSLLDAQIRFGLSDFIGCRRVCNELLEQTIEESAQRTALKLLGKSYERTGKHYAAALCFAGLLPEAVSENALPTNTSTN